MLDVVNGVPRVRQWPRKRGPAKTPEHKAQVDFFRHASWAAKFMHPDMMTIFMEARKGTALLPRDLAFMMLANTMFIIVLEGGKVLYPVQIIAKVSESLDALSQIEGMTLVRGEQFWQAVPYMPPTSGLQLFQRVEVTTPLPVITIDAIPQIARDLVINVRGRNTTNADELRLRLNNDAGNNYMGEAWNRFGTDQVNNGQHMNIGVITPNSAHASAFAQAEMTLADYASTTKVKTLTGQSMSTEGNPVGRPLGRVHSMLWRGTDPIQRLDFSTNGGNFAAGTVIEVYLRASAM